MVQTCVKCSRPNPQEALFCYFDGSALPGHSADGARAAAESQRFPHAFVFPSGQACHNFDELALVCLQNWEGARDLLQQGYLEGFLGSMGRADLALAAREAARFPDRDRGVDLFLAKLPSKSLQPPSLTVRPLEVRLGRLRVGEDRRFEVRLENHGMRLLYGTMTCEESAWLAVGEGPGAGQKLFEFRGEEAISVHVLGRSLRAGAKPLEGRIVIESNGGNATVSVTAEVPVTPFPEGVLAGAVTPRQVAEKAKAAPKEAAVLLENGAVTRWYKDNGWTFPVRGPVASGVGAVQQFFEALGLSPAPRVDISERAVTLQGDAGETLSHSLVVQSPEKRPVYAHGVSDQPWVEVGRAKLDGRTATVPLAVPSVPDRPGETLQATVTVTANGQQRFVVPVTLVVGRGLGLSTAPSAPKAAAAGAAAVTPGPQPVGAATLAPAATTPSVVGAPTPSPGAARRRPNWVLLLPAGLLVLALGGIALRDVFVTMFTAPAKAEAVDKGPRIAVQFHDGNKGDNLDPLLPEPTMRFGLTMLKALDQHGQPKRLTADPWGRTNNTCLRLDGDERLFGSPPGQWQDRAIQGWKDDQGRDHDGTKSIFHWPDKKVQVTQWVEVIPGEQTDLLDTCLVRYTIENQDAQPHRAGLRFLLDTFIGSNDGVPFTIPGEAGLCDDKLEFATPDKVPDFIEALENEDLAHPGTVAHVKLKLGGREPPSRVTLGAWPDEALQRLLQIPQAQGPHTKWMVPVLSMKTLWPYDSAVAIYWDEAPLAAGARREVGFAYGLGSVSSSGKLLLTVDGSFKPGGEFTLTALVREPAPGEELTLIVPAGFEVKGSAVQKAPELPPGAAGRTRPVTWRVQAGPVGKYELVVESSTGARQTQPLTIKASSIFD